MCATYLLSFQGPNGGLTFPMHGVSLQWFAALFAQHRTGDFAGSFLRSILLAVLVLGITVVLSVMAGLALLPPVLRAPQLLRSALVRLHIAGLPVGAGDRAEVPRDCVPAAPAPSAP